MRLNIQGANVSGTYSYDGIGQDLQLTGHLDAEGRLELRESVNKKQTGKLVCKRSLDDGIDSECSWTRPDGSHEAYVTLAEQNVMLSNGLKVAPRVITDRKLGVGVSYPQLTNGEKLLPPGASGFNRSVLSLVRKAIKEFAPGDEPGRNSFDTNYTVLLATEDVISVEMDEFSDSGGAHPNSRLWAVTYDLKGNKPLELDSLFKPDSDYKTAIAKYVVADIEKRADAIEVRDGRQPTKRDEPIVSEEQLSEISSWGMTPRGVVIYFDFPHVMAVFDKNFVPYSALKDYLRPGTAASPFSKS